MENKTYTAPAVIACADAVHNTKGIPTDVSDGEDGHSSTPGSVGFSL